MTLIVGAVVATPHKFSGLQDSGSSSYELLIPKNGKIILKNWRQ